MVRNLFNCTISFQEIEELKEDDTEKSDRAHYENAYLTLNRK